MSVIALGATSAVGIGMTVASNNASADGHAQADAILKAGGGCPDAPAAYSPEAEVWAGCRWRLRTEVRR
ncbi:hypothetical protein [Sorangium sp. So ce1097]|uniref:hypothetical protein n=1 Tax=Sorangium sp. So ce1097 TaxID=3133330 RepID=UPI003F61CCFE